MDLCQKNETDLENAENNEIQFTEETEPTYTCPDGKREKNHVYCLLDVSDITLEQDEKAKEFIIGTGWEEAVQGWGRTSPAACIWPRKIPKKARVGEGACSDCLVCVNLSHWSLQTKPPTEGGPEKDQSSPSQTQAAPQGPSTASRAISNICFPTYFRAEKKSLQIKEFIWCNKDWAIPGTNRGKTFGNPSGGAHRGLSIPGPLTSRALLVLPPLKASLSNALDVLGKKSKNSFLQSEEKVLDVEKDGCVACAYGLKTADGKGEKRASELAKHPMVNDKPSSPSPAARTSLLADPEQRCLHWSLLSEKNLACPPDPSNVHYLAALQLLQKQGVQNYKSKFKAKEPRSPVITRKHVLPKAKQENRPQMLETKVFPRPLLPSLTVSRVIIPVSTHRIL
ncbi:uncharacterized protein C16orf46 homolog isoform X1 [Gorilla gorilla gorilla]|uniref:uncharacterized protein C16orf46 homolog isoform X1 n=1 Tax=Gorilla gorilla gorilla TaxID=9595 RepID=UPI002446033B|nr:uncharacterized protein C16orf46 homolog [Gorilla gorilla gorilla]XP_018866924.2 uncharacterized protein C16orf46 homolog [Gorilla gorilla gorilla]XP_018866925.2 uncharacterized protein C16orf46 homolog [Gorilla gorilla gorilla]XP_055222722.1 uncharacterized protein C16orf46 homolog [Gorilla gorilla gorilla]